MMLINLVLSFSLIKLSEEAVRLSANYNCNWGTCSMTFDVPPLCDEESRAVQCLRETLHACSNAILIKYQLNAVILSEKVLCKYRDLEEGMRVFPECWQFAVKCSTPLVVNEESVNPEICALKRTLLEWCQNDTTVFETCRHILWKFADGLFDESTCGNSGADESTCGNSGADDNRVGGLVIALIFFRFAASCTVK